MLVPRLSSRSTLSSTRRNARMSSVIKPLVLSKLALWCALWCLTPSAALAAASSDAAAAHSLSSSSQTAIWMTTPAPTDGTEVEFPSNSVVYQRAKHILPSKSFFNTHWYTGIIIIVLVVATAYILLALWVCHHFEYSEQRKAKKVVEYAYVTSGFFDLDRSKQGFLAQRRRRSSSGESRTTVLRVDPSELRDAHDETYDWHSGSDSTTTSESDEHVYVGVNPLQRRGVALRSRAS